MPNVQVVDREDVGDLVHSLVNILFTKQRKATHRRKVILNLLQIQIHRRRLEQDAPRFRGCRGNRSAAYAALYSNTCITH